MERNRLIVTTPPGWHELLTTAAGEDTLSEFLREAIRREYKRRTGKVLPGDVRPVGKPKRS